MLGFVSALASSVAILILVVSISMANSFLSLLEKEERKTLFVVNVDNPIEGESIKSAEKIVIQDGIVPISLLSVLNDNDELTLVCSY
ncbi:hypothetical protein, partial [Vibrio metoecus]|uniref:hypothetical protein n=1 Tax=Vibrio metoecus TaxID=1481663 RepID=UPI00215CE7E7